MQNKDIRESVNETTTTSNNDQLSVTENSNTSIEKCLRVLQFLILSASNKNETEKPGYVKVITKPSGNTKIAYSVKEIQERIRNVNETDCLKENELIFALETALEYGLLTKYIDPAGSKINNEYYGFLTQ